MLLQLQKKLVLRHIATEVAECLVDVSVCIVEPHFRENPSEDIVTWQKNGIVGCDVLEKLNCDRNKQFVASHEKQRQRYAQLHT